MIIKLNNLLRKTIFYSTYKFFKIRVKSYINRKQNDESFAKEFELLKAIDSATQKRFILNWEDRYPCLNDKTTFTAYDRHYVLHPAWAARILNKIKPDIHYDISSTLYFGSIVSAFLKFKFFDFRPAKLNISDFESEHADLLNLPFDSNSIASLSCMHTLEHIGLGRYGDQLDYDGDLKAINELKRVLGKGGNLLVVVPIASEPRIYFNAHRVYSANQFISYFPELELVEFCLIPDLECGEDFIINPSEERLAKARYDCGCFWFRKNEIR